MKQYIRSAQLADAEAIARVHVAAWRWAYDGLMPQELLEGLDVAARTKQWQQQLCQDNGTAVFVLDDDAGIGGFVSCGPCRDGEARAEVYALYLLKEKQGTGAGRMLWQHACGWLAEQGHDAVQVWVLDTNELARRFYGKCGLSFDGRTKTSQWAGAELREVSYSGPLAGA